METAAESLACYGAMFPNLSTLATNAPSHGRVFSAFIQSCGIGIQSARVTCNHQQWEHCQKCSGYRACFDLSVAMLLLQHATGARG